MWNGMLGISAGVDQPTDVLVVGQMEGMPVLESGVLSSIRSL